MYFAWLFILLIVLASTISLVVPLASNQRTVENALLGYFSVFSVLFPILIVVHMVSGSSLSPWNMELVTALLALSMGSILAATINDVPTMFALCVLDAVACGLISLVIIDENIRFNPLTALSSTIIFGASLPQLMYACCAIRHY